MSARIEYYIVTHEGIGCVLDRQLHVKGVAVPDPTKPAHRFLPSVNGPNRTRAAREAAERAIKNACVMKTKLMSSICDGWARAEKLRHIDLGAYRVEAVRPTKPVKLKLNHKS